MKEFDPEELEQCDGKNGNPIYVVHQGKVFDLSESKLWKGGLHMKRHHAGGDLTTDLKGAPHGVEMLERYPQAGIYKKNEVSEIEIPKSLSWLLTKVPMLRRHPHPMTVHFPIVFVMSVAIFNILFLITGITSFEITALHCLGAGILFTPVAIITGLYTWWLNYLSKPVRAVVIKRRLSFLMLLLEVGLFVWRNMVPDIVNLTTLAGIIYVFLTLCLLPLVITIGWFGASLTFPIEDE